MQHTRKQLRGAKVKNSNIQEQLIKARIDSKLTQKEIAQKMNVAQSAVARFENTQNV
ncbi:helix-turn-helix domain-containing protein [Helicobacter japonicus]|uniref:XRE family transcriptional regulator n=1 Tax=Helicobacter japonicus TaxID=425400 RepID=A0A4V6I4B6_9HELI|nr:helix-turn-helix transcriptional regulator [Helicobacter japonicus]TLE03303.1 XRE family transcriptional regulator [Helicobacter japonicus]